MLTTFFCWSEIYAAPGLFAASKTTLCNIGVFTCPTPGFSRFSRGGGKNALTHPNTQWYGLFTYIWLQVYGEM